MQYTLVDSSGHFNNNTRITGIYKTTTDSGLFAAAQNKTTKNISFDGIKQQQTTTDLQMTQLNKKAVLSQGNRAMPQVFFSVEIRQQHSLQV